MSIPTNLAREQHKKSREVSIKTRSTVVSLLFNGQATKDNCKTVYSSLDNYERELVLTRSMLLGILSQQPGTTYTDSIPVIKSKT